MKRSENDWVMAGLLALGEGGIDAVRVEALARALAVTKGSFYHHFSGRQALQERMLEVWRDLGTRSIITGLEESGQDAASRLRHLAEQTLAPHSLDKVESAMRAWGAQSELVAGVVADVDEERLGYVRGLLAEVGLCKTAASRRANIFYRILIGEYTWRSHGGAALPPSAIADIVTFLTKGVDEQTPKTLLT